MSRLLSAVIGLIFLAGPCLALRSPRPESNEIDKAMLERAERNIRDGRGFAKQMEEAKLRLLTVEKAYWVTSDAAEKQRLERVIQTTNEEIDEAKVMRNAFYGKAANIVVKLYDIMPPTRVGKSVMEGTSKDVPATWVVLSDEPKPHKVTDKDGNVRMVEADSKTDEAVTFFDGSVIMHPAAFRNIAFLAATLYHERIHFEQYTTKGVGDKLNRHQREVKAYEAEIRNAGVFGLSVDEVQELSARKDGHGLGLDPTPGNESWYRHPQGHDNQGPDDDSYALPHVDDDLANIRSDAALLEGSVDDEFRSRAAEVHRQQAEAEERRFLADWRSLQTSAEECGFSVMTGAQDGWPGRITVIDHTKGSNPSYDFVFGHYLLTARFAFLLMRACIDKAPSPCNDSIGKLPLDRWEPEGRPWVGVVPVAGDHQMLYCMQDLRGYLSRTTDYGEVLKQVEVNDQRRWDAYRRSAADSSRGGGQNQPRPAPRPGRGGDVPPRGPDAPDCIREGGRCIRWR